MEASDWQRQTFGCGTAKYGWILKIPSLDGPSRHWLQFCLWVMWPKSRLLIGWEQNGSYSAKYGRICKIPTAVGPWGHWPSYKHVGHVIQIEASDWSRTKIALIQPKVVWFAKIQLLAPPEAQFSKALIQSKVVICSRGFAGDFQGLSHSPITKTQTLDL